MQKRNGTGTVIGGPVFATLNGVGYWWWNVDYNLAPDGWSAENWLTKVTVLGESTTNEAVIRSLQNQIHR